MKLSGEDATLMNHSRNGTIAIPAGKSIRIPIAARLPAIAVMMFGLVTLYVVGFSTSAKAHNATHDACHA